MQPKRASGLVVVCSNLPGSKTLSAAAMKHPVRADFDAAVTESGVSVTFKPTNSIYSFYRLAGASDIAPAGGGHAGVSGDTADYPPDEVQEMAQRIASEVAASVWRVQDQEEADRLTTVRPIVGDRGD